MIEITGLILGIVALLFAFETPRRLVVGLFSSTSVAKKESAGPVISIIDLCHRGISVKEI